MEPFTISLDSMKGKGKESFKVLKEHGSGPANDSGAE
jgi:hypothetical protein